MTINGRVYVLSGPSGAGKHVVLTALTCLRPGLELSVSSTSRAPRPGEAHGRDYYFFPRDVFEEKIQQDDFVEWAEVHGNLYGTLREELERHIRTGKDVVVQIDVQGMRSLRRAGVPITAIFIAPPSLEILRERLAARGTETPEALNIRLKNAETEMAASTEFDHIVVNDTIERAAAEVNALMG